GRLVSAGAKPNTMERGWLEDARDHGARRRRDGVGWRMKPDERPGCDLATEPIVVKIRWLGVLMGYVLVGTRTGLHDPWAVRAFLALGAGYAALETAFYYRLGEVVLTRWPLFVSLMESVFIALLCYNDTGLASPFRWYYPLSLICCAIRYRRTL